jgi:hypothetical protein
MAELKAYAKPPTLVEITLAGRAVFGSPVCAPCLLVFKCRYSAGVMIGDWITSFFPVIGVMTVLKRPPTWEESKKNLGDPSFMTKLIEFDKDKLDDAVLKKITKFTQMPDFTPDAIGKVSGAARGLCLWVRAMETYG